MFTQCQNLLYLHICYLNLLWFLLFDVQDNNPSDPASFLLQFDVIVSIDDSGNKDVDGGCFDSVSWLSYLLIDPAECH